MSRKTRIIFHMDMDHFYTAVRNEKIPRLKANPSLLEPILRRAEEEGCEHKQL